jgi:BirA family transcriptional regulator, biotin operon repressor / biotin---[acetyl-CoA-carboxylase] ligase
MTVDAKILSALRTTPAGVSGAELSRQLDMTRAGVWAHIEELRALGYDIEASPHLGYRLLGAPDALHADDLSARLGKVRVVGREIHVFQETTSTNDLAARLARGGAEEGAVIFAESQTKGRGRMGRSWVSPAGKGLWFTVLLRPNCPPQGTTQLTIAAATALARAVTLQTGVVPEIDNAPACKGRRGNAQVFGLLRVSLGQLDADFFQVQAGHFFVQLLGQAIDVGR